MKLQVARFSPHQNAKVFAILMAVSSLVFIVPFGLIAFASMPANAPGGAMMPLFMFVLAPLFYLVFGYISVVIGCAFYNFMFKFIGGIEYEAQAAPPETAPTV